MSHPYGMRWEDHIYHQQPVWTVEPEITTIESITRAHLHLHRDASCITSFVAQGAFSKIYKIETDRGSFILRVVLPVNMPHKTQSEVAVANSLRDKTSAPIARVYAYDASDDNPLRFPWVLMDLVPGHTVQKRWRGMSAGKREKLVKDVARFQSEVYCITLDMIGNIYQSPIQNFATHCQPPCTAIEAFLFLVGLLVSPTLALMCVAFFALRLSSSTTLPHPREFYIGPTISLDMLRASTSADRGPWSCTYEWFSARLTNCLSQQADLIETAMMENTEDALDDAYRYRQIAAWTRELPRLLPVLIDSHDEKRKYHLFPSDLHMMNIMVDKEDNWSGILDFEFIQSTPSWRCCRQPIMLDHRERDDEPDISQYGTDVATVRQGGVYADNEGVSQLYWEALLDFQLTQIMPVYLAEIERLQPRFLQDLQSGSVIKQFDQAIRLAERGVIVSNRPYVWLHKAKIGEDTSDILDQYTSLQEYKL